MGMVPVSIYELFHLVASHTRHKLKIKTIVAVINYTFFRLSDLKLVNNAYNARLGKWFCDESSLYINLTVCVIGISAKLLQCKLSYVKLAMDRQHENSLLKIFRPVRFT